MSEPAIKMSVLLIDVKDVDRNTCDDDKDGQDECDIEEHLFKNLPALGRQKQMVLHSFGSIFFMLMVMVAP